MTIWKFPLGRPDDLISLQMPRGSRILSVQVQDGVPCLWAVVDPQWPDVTRRFRWAGTGHPLKYEDSREYIGTFQLDGGALVFHLFDLGEA